MKMPVSFLHPNNTRSEFFRYLFANVTSLQFTGPEAIITFGVARNAGSPNDGTEEQIAVGMGVNTLKALVYSANRIIESYEHHNNLKVPIEPSLVSDVDRVIKAAEETYRNAKKST